MGHRQSVNALASGLGLTGDDRVAFVGGCDKAPLVAAILAAGWHAISAEDAAGAPLTAPAPLDLWIEPATTILVSVIGAGALGRVIADRCHRPLRIAALAGCSAYQRLTPAAAATVVLHERGSRRANPGARFCVAITEITAGNVGGASELAAELCRREPGLCVMSLTAT